jgi:putative FmdB family regulatory protein
MPIYEYQCKKCGAVSEILTTVGKEHLVSCKTCGSSAVKRLISAHAFLGAAVKQDPGRTCCGRADRCDSPPCSSNGTCQRD